MNKELIEKCNVLARRVETPSSHWSADGKPDPHGKTYDCERAGLHMGNMTDDELANGAFLNYDQPLNVAGILAGTCHSPIAWMTAVKDRIRWLSRSLEKVAAERDALAAELKALREQVPFDASEARFRDAFDAAIRRGDWPSARNGYGYRSPMTQMAWQASFCTVNRLGLYAHPVPTRELTGAVDALAQHIRQIDGNNSMGAGALAESIAEWADRYLKGEGE